jgi:cell fate regulator YaaT (PSP1 superfamily)
MEGINVIGVQFRRAGKLYDFSSGDADLRIGDHVVVDTDRGPSLAKVARIKFEDSEQPGERTLKPILRRASKKELDKKPRFGEDEVTKQTKEQVEKLELKMKVLKSEVQFGGNKVVVYFTAPGRIDFRTLVKELAASLKTRVELKQVGARDETKLLGGIGICGREYCCSTFLREFVPVSIRMAKNQNLALNPSKVSGGCGRLLCCLTYEDDVYTELRQKLPPRGTKVKLLDRGDTGIVIRSDILNQLILVDTENGQQVLVPVKEVEVISKARQVEEEAESGREEWGDDIDLALLTGADRSQVDEEEKGPQRGSQKAEGSGERQPREGSQQRNRSGRPRPGSQPRGERSERPQGARPGAGASPASDQRRQGQQGQDKRRGPDGPNDPKKPRN